MKTGASAVLHGLVGRPELNGKSVVLEAWLKQKERWTCRLDDGTEINVRPDNLRPPKKRRGTPPHVPEEPPRKESMRGFFERQKKARVVAQDPIIVEDSSPARAPRKRPSAASTADLPAESAVKPSGPSPSPSPSVSPRRRVTTKSSEKTVEQTYQKKTQLEHILLRPDSYVGSVERQHQEQWILTEERQMVSRPLSFVPALYKIFDEILVNAADNLIRDPSMDTIRVEIDTAKSRISVWNNGKGLPIEIHKEHGCYVPELVFGHLLTSDNYNDSEKKVVGGRNGYGAKLTNIYSKSFIVETADSSREKRYRQVWHQNMTSREPPEISKCKGQDFTSVSFEPDFSRFGMTHLEEDIVSLMQRRAYDIAASTRGRCHVFLNGRQLDVQSFEDYVGMFLESDDFRRVETCGDRWQVAVALTNGSGFRQVSFVNSICTSRGGTHVNHVTEQVVARVMEEIGQQKSDKAGHLSVKPQHVRNHLWIFVNCLIENPAFDSQTKETLTTKKERFGSRCELSDDLLQGIVDCGLIESLKEWSTAMGKSELARHLNKSDLGLQKRLFGIPKLEDANKAGTKDSQDCTLIITEGDSAKALAVAGLQVVGRDHYGVFPLRGKLRNVRELTVKQMMDNKEIEALMKIMAFDASKQYDDTKGLRYGSLMIMTDQDFDGSHIKGLVINFIQHWFPGLLRCEGFLREFVTPIVKVWRGREVMSFFTLAEYEAWKQVNNNGHGWSCKYYKGLGTSTAAEAKEYFSDLQQHELTFLTNDGDDALIDMAFNSKKADQRKEWISNCSGNEFVDHTQPTLTLNDFVQKELVLWAKYDVERAIPCLVDGLKPGQRKVLYCAFLKKLNQEIKVAQFSGFVAEKSAYHHGESSLQGTIIGMAQNFVGSNNINLLAPQGQFGTRMAGGKDHAAARYIFTRLSRTARFLFPPDDDPVLEYQSEEGQRIEPKWYCPVLPMVLVNGAEGIGVGWSTSVPNYNPRDLIAHLRRRLRGQPRGERLVPWYRGFRGTVARVAEHEGRFETIGVIQRRGLTKIEVTELPVRRWTQDYKEWIMEQMHENNGKRAMISEFREHHTDNTVHFSLSMLPEKVATAEEKGFEKAMHLKSWISTSNMFLFDAKGKLKKYDSPEEILEEFAVVRLQVYQQRKEHRIRQIQKEAAYMSEKAKFIRMVAEGELEVENRPAQQVCAELQRLGFRTKHQIEQGDVELRSPEPKRKRLRAVIPVPDQDLDLFGPDGYGYLLKMKMWTLTEERAAKLMEELEKLKELLKELRRTTLEEMWEKDLVQLEAALDVWEAEEQREQQQAERLSKKRQGHFEDDNSVNQQCVLLLSNSFSQIKRIRTARWKGRRRGGRGKMLSRKGTTVEAEDEDELPDAINAAFVCREFDSLLAFTKAGHVFKLQALDVPLMQHKDVSMPIEELAPALPKDDGVTAVIAVPFALKDLSNEFAIMVTAKGCAKRVPLSGFRTLRSGKLCVACPLDEGDALRWALRAQSQDILVMVSETGASLCFQAHQLRASTLKAKCVPAMKLGGDSMGGCGICRADARSLAKKFELVGVDDMVSRPGGRSW
ncbi:DNA topoisomerase 2 (DNA topoisomerase II) [Durusdinium trenchii]|uniref:DNA topoisomerase 2 n=2 Tax=Durusdinium trenchii TaxID=1381693 RepID=A0ABP0IDT3_9DINO